MIIKNIRIILICIIFLIIIYFLYQLKKKNEITENFKNQNVYINSISISSDRLTNEDGKFNIGKKKGKVIFKTQIPYDILRVNYKIKYDYTNLESNPTTSSIFITSYLIKNSNDETDENKSKNGKTEMLGGKKFISSISDTDDIQSFAGLKKSDFIEFYLVFYTDQEVFDNIRLDNIEVEYELIKEELKVRTSSFEQKANIIYNKNNLKFNELKDFTISSNINYYGECSLNNFYYISQIFINNDNDDNDENYIRFGIKNDELNEITFINLQNIHQNIDVSDIDINSEKYFDIVSSIYVGDIFIDNVVDLYSNKILGNKLLIYSNTDLSNKRIVITGYLATEQFNYLEYEKFSSIPINTSEDNYIKVYNEMQEFNNNKPHKNNFTIKKIIITEASSGINDKQINILIRNSYTNNIISYPGYSDNGNFIVYSYENNFTIYFLKTLVASEIIILLVDTAIGETINIDTSVEIHGYKAPASDVNKFILENNVTDVKGSINPNLLCPDLNEFMNEQLDSEIIMEAMNYQDKINTEKLKIASNKENLLTLLEQSEEIDKLERMVDKIKNYDKKNEDHAYIMNALQFKKNMEDYQILKEFLDKRIEERKKNTVDINIDVFSKELDEKIKKQELEELNEGFTSIDEFNDYNTINTLIKSEDNMKIN